jgi:hypothetical protein
MVYNVVTMYKSYSTPQPKFHKGQLVRIVTRNERGEFSNEWARRAEPYFAQLGELIRCQRHMVDGIPLLVYSVKMEDRAIIKVTEDCLVAAGNYISPSKTHWS